MKLQRKHWLIPLVIALALLFTICLLDYLAPKVAPPKPVYSTF